MSASHNGKSAARRWTTWKKRLIFTVIFMVVAFLGLELTCRYVLGLGDPPLLVSDTELEYYFKPSSSYSRFGNNIFYNAYSMRSDDFPAAKTHSNEFRVMVVGDSVINGGSLTDQKDLCTTLLQRQLMEKLQRPVVVGNISAGSWGPANHLAYIKRYGLFDADVAVFVFSSHDLNDLPSFENLVGVHPSYPDKTPYLATQELLMRYLPRYIGRQAASGGDTDFSTVANSEKTQEGSLVAKELLDTAGDHAGQVVVALHMEKEELIGDAKPEYHELKEIILQKDIELIELKSWYKREAQEGKNLYRDDIHPNEAGQQTIADALFEVIIPLAEKSLSHGEMSKPHDDPPELSAEQIVKQDEQSNAKADDSESQLIIGDQQDIADDHTADIVKKPFIVFDAIHLAQRPKHTKDNLSSIQMVYSHRLWKRNESREEPSLQAIKTVAFHLDESIPVCLDIEHWPLRGTDAEIEASLDKLILVIKTMKEEKPGLKIGYYGMLPFRDYGRAGRNPDAWQHKEWTKWNERTVRLAEHVDYIFPSLYTFDDDRAKWKLFADSAITFAKQFEKPVYVFLWPQFHKHGKYNSPMRPRPFLPPDYWQEELEYVYQKADGAVIWIYDRDHNGQPLKWSGDYPWWNVLQEFIEKNDINVNGESIKLENNTNE